MSEVEDLISWHKERAAWYEKMTPSAQPGRKSFQDLRRRHEDTAELLAELVGLRNFYDDMCGDD